MNNYPKIYLHSKKTQALRRFHPWVFSGAIANKEGNPTDGDIVEVFDTKSKDFLATGHYHQGSIAIKILSFEQVTIDNSFWLNKFQKAYAVRAALGLPNSPNTNAYRLIHGEGDGLPGLIVDIYNNVAVVQAHTIGMHRIQAEISEAIQQLYGDRLTAIYSKSKATLPSEYAKTVSDEYLFGEQEVATTTILENDQKFQINWQTGQKTGFFLDQRNNRQILGQWVKDKTVLNAFCYSGGFSIYALQAGAKLVHSVDSSAKAIDLLNENVQINDLDEAKHEGYVADVLKFLKETSQTYEVMVLDPPAYAKTMSKRHRAIQGYKRLNIEGLKHIAKGGILLTFSCSQVVDRQLFYNTIVAAAIEAKRQVRVLGHLTQPADHPVSIFHPEGSYLKGLLLYVE